MIETYASAALIVLASLLVGRATFSLAGRRDWCWLEGAVGFGAILTASGRLARAAGHRVRAGGRGRLRRDPHGVGDPGAGARPRDQRADRHRRPDRRRRG